MSLTPSIIMAAAQDAGNRSMRKAGRTNWSLEDWNVAAEVAARLRRTAELLEEATA